MFQGYKIVTITPVGRRKHIDNLYPTLLANKGLVDQHIFWINTNTTYDVGYAYSILAKDADYFKIVGSLSPKSNTYTNDIYLGNNNPKTIYIKISDDICWFEPNAIQNLVQCCINNPEHSFVYPLTVNTGKTTMFHQVVGAIPADIAKISPLDFRKSNFNLSTLDASVSADIHNDFLQSLSLGDISKYYGFFEKYIVYDFEHIPMHCVAWLGNPENKKYRDEAHLANLLINIIPKQKKMPSCICGDALVAHFAYTSHEDYLLSKTDILERYMEAK